MITRLYNWSLEKVSGPMGEKWLAALSFAESSFFPIPADALLLPMMWSDPRRVWRLATITTLMSVLGAVFGYLIGALFFQTIGQPIVELYGYEQIFADFGALYKEWGILIILIGGLTPVPFKVITIASGVFALNPLIFFVFCFPARAPRFFLEAALLWKFGPSIRKFVEKRLPLMMTLFLLVVISGFLALKWV